MYTYKINNSYTVYVNHSYYNECKKKTKSSNYKGVSKQTKPPKVSVAPPIHAAVIHKTFGYGEIVRTNEPGYLSVAFGRTVKRFMYPSAFQQGFLAYA